MTGAKTPSTLKDDSLEAVSSAQHQRQFEIGWRPPNLHVSLRGLETEDQRDYESMLLIAFCLSRVMVT